MNRTRVPLLPSPRTRVNVVVADDNDMVVRWTDRGANDGEFQENSPTGAPVTLTGINSYHIVCGQMAERIRVVAARSRERALQRGCKDLLEYQGGWSASSR